MLIAALLAGHASGAERSSAAARGYNVVDYRWDPVLLQRWAVLQDAEHPERPLLAERVESSRADVTAVPQAIVTAKLVAAKNVAAKIVLPIIHVGDQVTLWSEEGNVRLQLGAVSQQDAALGARVQLRVTGAGVNGSTGWQATGTVRGPGNVEMER